MAKIFTRPGIASPVYVDSVSGEPTMNVAGDLSVNLATGLNLPEYDYCEVTYPINTTEVYTFKEGGASGTTVATVTVVYTDSSKESLSTVTKTL